MVTKKKFVVIGLFVLLALLLVFSLHYSKLHAIDQYLTEREVWLGSSYPIPYTDLRWSLSDINISNNLYESGWTLSDVENTSMLSRDGQDMCISAHVNTESGILKDDLYIVTVTVIVTAVDNGNSDYEENAHYLPIDFLKWGDKTDVSSFSKAKGPDIFLAEDEQDTGNSIYVASGEECVVKLAYFGDRRFSVDNGVLFTNVIPTQTVSVCIQLNRFI